MGLTTLLDQCYQSFLYHAEYSHVILLHPDSRYRSLIVAQLLNDPSKRTFYYAFGPDDISVESLVNSMTHDMADQHPTFGRHTHILPDEVWQDTDKNFNAILDAFLRDVAELDEQPFFLILDEYDRGDEADDVQRFIEGLCDYVPDHCCLVINSRTLPRLPWISLAAKRRAVLLLDDQQITTDFYRMNRPDTKYSMEVYALGPGFVLLNGQAIDTWEGHLPRLLFFFALDKCVITRSEICEAFWPELDMDQAVNVFHVTKRRLHKALDMDVLVHDEGYYRVNPDMTITYDVMDFVEALIAARNEHTHNRMEAWQRAVDLYRGPFLQGHADPWIVSRRADFRTGFLEALHHIASYWIGEGRNEHALTLYQRAIAEDPFREDIHQEMMLLYAKMGRRSEAAGHYQRLIEDFKRHNRKLSPRIQVVHEQIMQG
jgi:DNA-binding SARP family transcriptional activator